MGYNGRMTTSSNDSSGADSAEVSATGGMASGSEGVGQAGSIDDSQLPEDLRPDAEGLTGGDDVSGEGGRKDQTLGEGATEQAGQLPEPAAQTPDDASGVAEPTA